VSGDLDTHIKFYHEVSLATWMKFPWEFVVCTLTHVGTSLVDGLFTVVDSHDNVHGLPHLLVR